MHSDPDVESFEGRGLYASFDIVHMSDSIPSTIREFAILNNLKLYPCLRSIRYSLALQAMFKLAIPVFIES
jgi:hypothetical protein